MNRTMEYLPFVAPARRIARPLATIIGQGVILALVLSASAPAPTAPVPAPTQPN